MKIFADLHLHSSYSRGTSTDMNLQNIEKFSRIKGLNLLGTGDFTHPRWVAELKESLAEDETGILKTKTGLNFILQTEISLIYSQDGKTRRIHNIILAPSFEIVEQINAWLKTKGRLDYDGRPIFGFSCIELVENLMGISKDIAIIPAHCWTPWYSLYGSNSGFDSIKECFQDQLKHIHAIETGLSCYDEKTEILTNAGWKKFTEVCYEDDVCTLNLKTGEIEFQNPIKIHAYPYKGKMYRLRTTRVDLLVTPNHQLLYSPCDFRKPPKFILKEAGFLFNKSKRFKKDGLWNGTGVEYFTLPAVNIRHGSRYYSGKRIKREKKLPIKQWLKFFGFWTAEGWTTEGKNGEYVIGLANKDDALLSEMKRILEGFGYTVYWDRRTYSIRVRDYQLFSYLKQFGKCSNKFIPLEIKALSKELLGILFDYYIKGDDHIYGRSDKGLSATTSSIRLRDDLQEIALKLGISAYYKLHKKKGTPFRSPSQGYKKIYRQNEDTWVIYFIRRNLHAVLPCTNRKYNHLESWVNFEGPVYCVTVPNQVIYVRRNGIPVWCGNSDPAMNWRLSELDNVALISNSDSHSFWPWRIGREANVFELKELTYKNLVNAIREKDPKRFLYTIEVDPSYGKYHLDGHRLCNICLEPEESIKTKNICPKCRRKLTVGVLHRVEELADRPEGFVLRGAIPFKTAIPLSEIISGVLGVEQPYSKKVWEVYNKLIGRFGSEFAVLLDIGKEEMTGAVDEKIAEAIVKIRDGKIRIQPGYDGVYGYPVFDGVKKEPKETPAKEKKKGPQKGLDEFFP